MRDPDPHHVMRIPHAGQKRCLTGAALAHSLEVLSIAFIAMVLQQNQNFPVILN
jgi:hypothetical protein